MVEAERKGHGVYAMPPILDATVCIFMEYVRSGTRQYSESPYAYTRYQEKYNANWQLSVVGFAPSGQGGLHFHTGSGESDGVGGPEDLRPLDLGKKILQTKKRRFS